MHTFFKLFVYLSQQLYELALGIRDAIFITCHHFYELLVKFVSWIGSTFIDLSIFKSRGRSGRPPEDQDSGPFNEDQQYSKAAQKEQKEAHQAAAQEEFYFQNAAGDSDATTPTFSNITPFYRKSFDKVIHSPTISRPGSPSPEQSFKKQDGIVNK